MSAVFELTDVCKLCLSKGDITHFTGDAIVNAANELMLGGGGVDGAIHRAAGKALLQACRQVPEVSPGVRCPTGEARITEAFKLPTKYVIHTVGPVYKSDAKLRPLLESAYRSSLQLANQPDYGIRSIAFPAISCGVYGYPVEDAAKVALNTAAEHCGSLDEVHFVLFGDAAMQTFVDCATETFKELDEGAAAT